MTANIRFVAPRVGERGLKLLEDHCFVRLLGRSPRRGAWIEMTCDAKVDFPSPSLPA